MPAPTFIRTRSSPDQHGFVIIPRSLWVSSADSLFFSEMEDQAEAVVKSFFETLLPDEQQLFEATKLSEHVLDDIKRADAAHKDKSRSRKISAVLKPFLSGVLQYGKAVDVLSQSSAFLSPIWGGVRVVLHVCELNGIEDCVGNIQLIASV